MLVPTPVDCPDGGPRIELRQGLVRVMGSRHPEILLEGPAGTGKTFGLVWLAHTWSEMYPGARGYFVRQTRKSLNESAMSLFEDLLGYGHPVLKGNRARPNRDKYVYPYRETVVDGVTYAGQSEIYLVGMDNPDRLMSTEGDWAMFFEGTEGTLDGWDKLGSRIRRHYMPFNTRILDCNPGPEMHWVNLRAEEKLEVEEAVRKQLGDSWRGGNKMQRIRTTLADNPKYWDAVAGKWTEAGLDYKVKLASLSPINRQRLEAGEWVSAAGQVFPNFRRERHVVNGQLVNKDGRWWLEPVVNRELGIKADFERREARYFLVSYDWGFADPAVAQLWAVDEKQRAFLVREMYQTETGRDEWARRLKRWQDEFGRQLKAIVMDHDPDLRRMLNEMLSGPATDGRPIATLAAKDIVAGIDVCRWELEDDDDGEPRVRFFSDALEHEDQSLREKLLATSTLGEISSFVYPPRIDGKVYKGDKPDPHCDDHGMDAWRYRAMYLWRQKHQGPKEPEAYAPGTMGAKFNHKGRMRRARHQARARGGA